MTEQTEKEILSLLKTQQGILINQEKTLKEHSKAFEEQSKFNKEVLEMLKNQSERIEYISADLKKQKEKLDYVSEDLRNFSQHFAVFEYDFSLKVDALFEKYGSDFDEHKVFKKDINSLKDDSFKHGVQIEHLSKKIVNA